MKSVIYNLDDIDRDVYKMLLNRVENNLSSDKKKELKTISKALEISYEELLLLRNEAKKHQIALGVTLPSLPEYLQYLEDNIKGGYMENLTFKEIKDLGFQIDEDVHHVTQFYKVNLDTDTPISEFSRDDYEADIIETNYDIADTTYSISKNGNIIDTGQSEQGVINFFITGAYKKY